MADTIDQVPEDEHVGASGSIDVAFSQPKAPVVQADDLSDANVPEEVGGESSRLMRAAVRVEDAMSSGVGKLGGGITALGGGLEKVGAQVGRIPMVGKTGLGAGVKELGGGIADLGASLHGMPVIAKTARGRVLFRSLVVGLSLVAAWIAAIVWFQSRGESAPDMRPTAEALFARLATSDLRGVFDDASTRFKEVTVFDRFEADMKDMRASLGNFKEIAAVNETTVTRSAGGRVARVEAQVDYDKGRAPASVTFLWEDQRWRLLGVVVDLPEDVAEVETSREARCTRSRKPEVLKGALTAMKRLLILNGRGQADQVWAQATTLFQQSMTQTEFVALEEERTRTLGHFKQVLNVVDAYHGPANNYVPMDVLVEYEKAVTTVSLGFSKIDDAWRMSAYRVDLPMPRTSDAPSPSRVTTVANDAPDWEARMIETLGSNCRRDKPPTVASPAPAPALVVPPTP